VQSINRNDPSYTVDHLAYLKSKIDAFAKYDNTLAFLVGNEVANSDNTTRANVFVKATVRDAKRYMRTKSRYIPMGYAALTAMNCVLPNPNSSPAGHWTNKWTFMESTFTLGAAMHQLYQMHQQMVDIRNLTHFIYSWNSRLVWDTRHRSWQQLQRTLQGIDSNTCSFYHRPCGRTRAPMQSNSRMVSRTCLRIAQPNSHVELHTHCCTSCRHCRKRA
jgi:hypothetical protein